MILFGYKMVDLSDKYRCIEKYSGCRLPRSVVSLSHRSGWCTCTSFDV